MRGRYHRASPAYENVYEYEHAGRVVVRRSIFSLTTFSLTGFFDNDNDYDMDNDKSMERENEGVDSI